MSKLFLDLKNMKKVKSDKDTTVFEHKSGHQIHVKNSALSPKMREEMERLMKGRPSDHQAKSKAARQKFAEGTPDAPIQSQAQDSPEQIMQDAQAAPLVDPRQQQLQQYKDQISQAKDMNGQGFTPEQVDQQAQVMLDANTKAQMRDAAAAQNVQKQQDFARAQSGDPTYSSPEADRPPIQINPTDRAPTSIPQGATLGEGPAQMPAAPPKDGTSAVSGGMMKGLQEQRAGIDLEAKAKSQQADQTAAALQAEQIAKNDAIRVYQDQQTNLNKEREALIADYKNQHIKPDSVWRDKSAPQKISTIIGLMLGGIGSGLLHQENPVMKMLNQQIDRNIDAQKAELGKSENLLTANFKQFGNLQAAMDFTRVNHNDMIKNAIDQAAAKAGTPMAQAEALKAKGALDKESGMLMAKMGAIQTISNTKARGSDINSALQTLRMVDPEKAKEIETRIVPNVGMAEVPLDAATRGKILAHQQLDERARDLLQFAQQHSGSLDPRVKAAGIQKVLALQSLYREGVLGTVYREGEQPLLDKVVKDPTSFFNSIGNIPKLEELLKSNNARFGVLKDQVGLKPFAGQVQQTAPKRFVPAQSFKPRH